jgi:hypothetical protein
VLGVLKSGFALATAVPTVINVQGVLRDQNGILQVMPANITFNIYNTAAGDTVLFSETQTNVQVIGGVFSTKIGAGANGNEVLSPALFESESELWMEIQVEGDAAHPRFQLTSSPYAFKAEYANTCSTADTVASLAVDNAALKENAVTSGKILNGTISSEDIGADAVNGTHIVAGSISGEHLAAGSIMFSHFASNGCAAGDVITYVASGGSSAFSCEAGTYSAGSGLLRAGTVFSIAPGGVINSHLGASVVTSSNIEDESIVSADIKAGTVTGADIASGTIDLANLASNGCLAGQVMKSTGTAWSCGSDTDTVYTSGNGLALDTTQNVPVFSISPSGINTNHVANGTLTFADLASNSCQNGNVIKFNGTAWSCGSDIDTTYTSGDGLTLDVGLREFSITQEGVLSGHIADGTVALADLDVDSVDSSKILDGTIATNDINDNAVSSLKIEDGTVISDDLAAADRTGSLYLPASNDSGNASTLSRSDHHHPAGACPTALAGHSVTTVTSQASGGNLCVVDVPFADPANWNAAIDDCWSSYGGQLCTINQLRIYCHGAGVNPEPSRWLGDRRTESESYLTRANNPTCDNFVDKVDAGNTRSGYYCCLTVPRI